MKKLFLTNLSISIFISLLLLLMPWNINFAKSGCDGIVHKAFCKNSLTITQSHISGNTSQEIVPGAFPFDDLIIKI